MGACVVSGGSGHSQLDSTGGASGRRHGGRLLAGADGPRLAAALRTAVGGGKFHQRDEAGRRSVAARSTAGTTTDRSVDESGGVLDTSLVASNTAGAFQQSNITSLAPYRTMMAGLQFCNVRG